MLHDRREYQLHVVQLKPKDSVRLVGISGDAFMFIINVSSNIVCGKITLQVSVIDTDCEVDFLAAPPSAGADGEDRRAVKNIELNETVAGSVDVSEVYVQLYFLLPCLAVE